MKFSQSKVLLVVALAFVLVIGSSIVVRNRIIHSQPSPHTRSYAHKHLPPSEWEPTRNIIDNEYKLRDGETLASIARRRYGHQKYSAAIKLLNHIQDDIAVNAGTILRVPDMSLVLKEEGVTNVAPTEVEQILCSRAKYDRVVAELWRPRSQRTSLPPTIKQELLEAADDLQQATEGLKTAKPRIKNAPTRMIGQLEQNVEVMRSLAAGDSSDPNGYDIDLVQQRYALAVTYAIIWAREGFN